MPPPPTSSTLGKSQATQPDLLCRLHAYSMLSFRYNVTYESTTGSTGHVALRSANGTFSAANDPRKAAGAGLALN